MEESEPKTSNKEESKGPNYEEEEHKTMTSTDIEKEGKDIINQDNGECSTMTSIKSEKSNLNLGESNELAGKECKTFNKNENSKSLISNEKGESKFKIPNGNIDRLVPRSHQRKRESSSSSSHETREKRQREGAEELQRLRKGA